MKIRAIITGATGMVGEGVLHECLHHADVEQVLVINRSPCGISHPKLKEILHQDFYNLAAIEDQLYPYNACFFCLGTSSVGMSEKDYHRVSYDLTMHVAETLVKLNPGMIFCYVSGAGTDSSEQGHVMWARVKGKTENHLQQLPFKQVYAFRPGFMKPTEGLKNTSKYYFAIGWLYRPMRTLFPKFVSTLQELGLAMIHTVSKGYHKPVLEVKDIVDLAKR